MVKELKMKITPITDQNLWLLSMTLTSQQLKELRNALMGASMRGNTVAWDLLDFLNTNLDSQQPDLLTELDN